MKLKIFIVDESYRLVLYEVRPKFDVGPDL